MQLGQLERLVHTCLSRSSRPSNSISDASSQCTPASHLVHRTLCTCPWPGTCIVSHSSTHPNADRRHQHHPWPQSSAASAPTIELARADRALQAPRRRLVRYHEALVRPFRTHPSSVHALVADLSSLAPSYPHFNSAKALKIRFVPELTDLDRHHGWHASAAEPRDGDCGGMRGRERDGSAELEMDDEGVGMEKRGVVAAGREGVRLGPPHAVSGLHITFTRSPQADGTKSRACRTVLVARLSSDSHLAINDPTE
eukprot:3933744-Rhodomonas_salina.2